MRRALFEDRPFLIVSLVLAIAYPLLVSSQLGELYLMLVKSGGIVALAMYALRRLVGTEAILLCLYLAVCALGDALIIIDMVWGGTAFFTAHIFAIILFARHRRPMITPSQYMLAGALLVGTPVMTWLLTLPETDWGLIFYSLILAIMAAMAWTSAYPRYQVGIGAILFVISDLLLFGSIGRLADIPFAGALVWPIYYAGQLMLCTGVVRVVRNRS